MLGDGFHDVPQGKLAMVVTHLEMREKAELRPVPQPEGLALQPLHKPALSDYRALFRHIGAEWLWFSRTTLNDTALSAILNDPDVHLYTLLYKGQAEALLELDFRQANECELSFFGLSQTLIGKGAGRYLMNVAIEQAWSRPINRFHVHTCTLDSPAALGFYQRSGFTAIKRQIEIADDPRLTAGWDTSLAPQIPIIPPHREIT